MPTTNPTILALDVGEVRVGVAIASLVARIPRPLTTLERGKRLLDELQELLDTESVKALVVGYPRNLDGQATAQTAATERFVESLRAVITIPVHLQDEALTSRKAEAELEARGKPYAKGDIDALAATYILEDYLAGAGNESLR